MYLLHKEHTKNVKYAIRRKLKSNSSTRLLIREYSWSTYHHMKNETARLEFPPPHPLLFIRASSNTGKLYRLFDYIVNVVCNIKKLTIPSILSVYFIEYLMTLGM